MSAKRPKILKTLQALRDTDKDWRQLAKTNPYFAVLSNEKFLSDRINDEALEDFFAAGQGDINFAVEVLKRRYPDFAPKTALDFGCGVGRLTRALAQVVDTVHGVDVAEEMLQEAKKNAPERTSFSQNIPNKKFDWIVSIIVFQHIPPTRGYELMRQLFDALSPGGFLTLQVTLYRDKHLSHTGGGRFLIDKDFTDISDDESLMSHDPGAMLMYDYDLSKITGMMFEAGFNHYEVSHTNHGGFNGVFIHSRKNP